ncbi:G-type lectin S-receptor-like serine/threonine-protein kinase At1g11300 isoform X2 [Tasmannia lanceolata]|uniref:G-type lectin S-receptor-like serine/threonine-protein kinase At1g11300 isoform X2 n=1 Tax=Tasmannia lanceolata TaxID=3420 RepID=UPI0040629CEF
MCSTQLFSFLCKFLSNMSNEKPTLSYLFLPFIFVFQISTAIDFINSDQPLRDGQTLIPAGGSYELGFFSPSQSKNRYVGIWYKNVTVQTVIWVLNRENPVTDSSGLLTINGDGNLVLLDREQNTLWSSDITVASKNTTAKLLDSSNLVLREGNSDDARLIWQSFDHLTDTYLIKSRYGVNLKTGEKQRLTCWKSENDPAPGNFSLLLEPKGQPQVFLYNGSRPIWRTGQWNGRTYLGVNEHTSVNLGLNLINDIVEGRMYISFSRINNDSYIPRLAVDWSGKFKISVWIKRIKEWQVISSEPSSTCHVYGTCGPFGVCNDMGLPICRCMKGFGVKSVDEWREGNWSSGCVRLKELDCERNGGKYIEEKKRDGFSKLVGVKVPDLNDWVPADNATICRDECLKNCSCVAYAYVSGIWCMVWGRSLLDTQELSSSDGLGEELYIRLAHSEFGKKKKIQELSKLGSSQHTPRDYPDKCLLGDAVKEGKQCELLLLDFYSVARATRNFCDENKLGEGGFGPVYKGQLADEQEIAVKRLSRSSSQGLEEFKNEVALISKLQHRNLVRLLGCCIEGDEKMLVYEYMPNKSLDFFLFDPMRNALLDWGKRIYIVEGIARGLLYLHRDSRLKIIHRDLKASNILLDAEMNPKISDFGMAKIFGGNQTLANTNRVVGTYGYMAPEYAMEGRFSEKSDVFSFGVLLLEIVSSKKNTSVYHHEQYLNLLGYVWKLWNEDALLELMEPSMEDPFSITQVLRCIHVGLLCVQECEIDRPTMSSVVLMLGGVAPLPMPKQPAFSLRRNPIESSTSSSNDKTCSVNNVTVTMIGGR